jgi:hypothetical protein
LWHLTISIERMGPGSGARPCGWIRSLRAWRALHAQQHRHACRMRSAVARDLGNYVHIDDAPLPRPANTGAAARSMTSSIGWLTALVDGTPAGARSPTAFARRLNTVEASALRSPVAPSQAQRHRRAAFHQETSFLAELKDVLVGRTSTRGAWRASPTGGQVIEKTARRSVSALGRDAIRCGNRVRAGARGGDAFVTALRNALGAAGAARQLHLLCHSAGSIWIARTAGALEGAGGPAIGS